MGFGSYTVLKPRRATLFSNHIIVMEKIKLIIRAIVGEEKNGMSRVIVSRDALGAIIQTNQAQYNKTLSPVLKFTDEIDSKSQDIRVFEFDGARVYSFYDRAGTGKSYFFMNTEEAKKCLMTLAQERENLPKLSLDVSEFDLDIVSSAPATA